MFKLLIAAFVTLLPVIGATQDYNKGLAASQSGDFSTALMEWLPLTEQDHAEAQNGIGFLYHFGHGVSQDHSEAVRWYRLAAEQDLAIAQHNLGFMYNYGFGVQLDYNEAVRWYHLAAEQGIADAQYNLALMYANGHGVSQNETKAMYWIRKAADQGITEAEETLERFRKAGEQRYSRLFFGSAAFFLIAMPMFGAIAAPFAIILLQKETVQGDRTQVKLNNVAYLSKIAKIYALAIGAILFLNTVGIFSNNAVRTVTVLLLSLVSLASMGALLNYAAKRLAHMGYSKAFALVGIVPFFGHAFFVYLAYTFRKKPSFL
ncbi:MAG: tetratricopeptide repeat protein [Paracoccaceae bacterium]|nr:tetratricopeptide repeat protein [Paracoccaceae bacterium]MDG2260184.1 tetratricopeptide repeat protein [Paracoccaceae bacterium]